MTIGMYSSTQRANNPSSDQPAHAQDSRYLQASCTVVYFGIASSTLSSFKHRSYHSLCRLQRQLVHRQQHGHTLSSSATVYAPASRLPARAPSCQPKNASLLHL